MYAHPHSPYCANSPYFYRGADWVPQAPCHGHGLSAGVGGTDDILPYRCGASIQVCMAYKPE